MNIAEGLLDNPELLHYKGFGGPDLVVECKKLEELADEIDVLVLEDLLGAEKTQTNELLPPDLIVWLEERLGRHSYSIRLFNSFKLTTAPPKFSNY